MWRMVVGAQFVQNCRQETPAGVTEVFVRFHLSSSCARHDVGSLLNKGCLPGLHSG